MEVRHLRMVKPIGLADQRLCLSNLDKRTMMVLYRSPEYYAVQVNNEDKYQIDY